MICPHCGAELRIESINLETVVIPSAIPVQTVSRDIPDALPPDEVNVMPLYDPGHDGDVDYLNTPLQIKLRHLDACSEARRWVGQQDFRTAWGECHDRHWMVWLLQALHIAECNCDNGHDDDCPVDTAGDMDPNELRAVYPYDMVSKEMGVQ